MLRASGADPLLRRDEKRSRSAGTLYEVLAGSYTYVCGNQVIHTKLYHVYVPEFAVHVKRLGVSNRVVTIWRLFKQMNLTVEDKFILSDNTILT